MSDFNVDKASDEDVMMYAKDVLGLEVEDGAEANAVREQIKVTLGEASVRNKSRKTRVSQAKDASASGSARQRETKKNKVYVINVAKKDGEKQPVQVGINGRLYLIRRGEDVKVPEPVVEVLRNAKKVVYDPETMEPTEVLSYPFNVVDIIAK